MDLTKLQKKQIILVICIFTFILSSIAFIQYRQDSSIVGTWLAKKDHNTKWVFTNDSKTKWYYKGNLKDTFDYRISTKSPQCGEQVQTGPKIEFLELTNVNSGEQRCYYINGLTNSILSLSPFGRSNILLFERQ